MHRLDLLLVALKPERGKSAESPANADNKPRQMPNQTPNQPQNT